MLLYAPFPISFTLLGSVTSHSQLENAESPIFIILSGSSIFEFPNHKIEKNQMHVLVSLLNFY